MIFASSYDWLEFWIQVWFYKKRQQAKFSAVKIGQIVVSYSDHSNNLDLESQINEQRDLKDVKKKGKNWNVATFLLLIGSVWPASYSNENLVVPFLSQPQDLISGFNATFPPYAIHKNGQYYVHIFPKGLEIFPFTL